MSEENVRVRVVKGDFTVIGEDTYEEGEEFEISANEAALWDDVLERVDEESDEDESVEPPFDPSEYTIDKLEAKLEENDYSEAEIEALQKAEEEGEDRDGALDALGA